MPSPTMKKTLNIIHHSALSDDVGASLRILGLKQLFKEYSIELVHESEAPQLLKRAPSLVLWDHASAEQMSRAPQVQIHAYGAVAAFFCQVRPLRVNREYNVFVPSGREGFKAFQKQFFNELRNASATLFVPQLKEDLALCPTPGMATLYSPFSADLHARAIATSQTCYTFELESALVAIAHKVPAILFAASQSMKEKAVFFGIPFVEVQGSDTPFEVHQRALTILEHYPWDEAIGRIIQIAKQFIHTINTADIQAKFEFRPLHRVPLLRVDPEEMVLCSISDSNYLPFLEGYIENALEKEGASIHFFILDLDGKVSERLKKRFSEIKITTVLLQDLWSSTEMQRISTRSVGFRAFSSKPKLIKYALEKTKAPVFYCDSDVYFFDKPSLLKNTLGNGTMVLFPHWNDVFPAARLDGLYNAGMVGVCPGSEKILNWWAAQTLSQCQFDQAGGHVGDQSYLDFVPVHFEGVTVYRGKDHNVARWNLKSLGVQWECGWDTPRIHTGQRVKTFHAAFLDEKGIFEVKNSWDQLLAWCSKDAVFTPALLENVEKQQRRHWLALSRALKLKETLSFFPVVKNIPHSNWVNFFVGGKGQSVLAWVLEKRKNVQDLPDEIANAAVEESSWGSTQHAYLFEDTETVLKQNRG